MNPLFSQFLLEGRELLQTISEKLLALEKEPESQELITELFRAVHTLKGTSGLFEIPEMTNVLHSSEDLMDAVRDGRLAYSQELADRLLDAMDFVSLLFDILETGEGPDPNQIELAKELSSSLRDLIPVTDLQSGETDSQGEARDIKLPALSDLPEDVRLRALSEAGTGGVNLIVYSPDEGCFFKGEDPFYQALNIPGLLWGRVVPRTTWPPLSDLDCYRCMIDFQALSKAPRGEVLEYFRYVPNEVAIMTLSPTAQSSTADRQDERPTYATKDTGFQRDKAYETIAVQAEVLNQPEDVAYLSGRLQSVAKALSNCLSALGQDPEGLNEALAQALQGQSSQPLRDWLSAYCEQRGIELKPAKTTAPEPVLAPPTSTDTTQAPADRRPETPTTKVLKVDQAKVDRLMNLIGELVVAKNALPYLASRAENQYGVRELSREIKAQYAVINRIADEMQDAIMQVRMMPVSLVFQRFQRLVRDLSRKLNKDVELIIEGEETEADKNIIEALADPLIHIIRNSLDHGLEDRQQRQEAGKSPTGRLMISARQESDHLVIEVSDDGKGIDPAVIKQKAYERGLLTEERIDKISDREALNLIFAPGFSTAEAVTDLSGRGVGMDVVRSTIDRLGGTVHIHSEVNRGTRIRLTLPLSMAVSNVMIIESDHQIFGVPMELVVETVRVPRRAIHSIKKRQTTVMRGRVVPLIALNTLLDIPAAPIANDEDELATLVVRIGNEPVGILVDNFRETVDVILKPMPGDLGRLSFYAGTALLGDGSVLMVLNLKELFRWQFNTKD